MLLGLKVALGFSQSCDPTVRGSSGVPLKHPDIDCPSCAAELCFGADGKDGERHFTPAWSDRTGENESHN